VDGAHHLGKPVRRLAVAAILTCLAVASAWAAGPQIVPPPSRDVTPPGMTPGPTFEGPLIREAVPPPPPDPPRWHRYFLPETTDAATFAVDRRTIKLAGVKPPPVDQTCRFASGEDWPCGRTALFSLRMFLRGRAIDCFFVTGDPADPLIAPCRVGKTDLGLWLLEQGWAKPTTDASDEYAQTAKQARCGGKGMWRETEAPSDCPTN
jgi:endonuclease YncB( thermonuclease family)